MRRRPSLSEIFPARIEARRAALIGAGFFLLAFLVTLIALLVGAGRKPGGAPVKEQPQASAAAARALGIQDFILEFEEERTQPAIYPFRERMSRWTKEQVRRYWIPLEQVVLDIVSKENDRRIEELLKGIP